MFADVLGLRGLRWWVDGLWVDGLWVDGLWGGGMQEGEGFGGMQVAREGGRGL